MWLLGLTQIIGYGTLYYGFAILAPDIGAEFGWPVAWVYGALSLALLAGGIVAPFAGSRIDRHGAARVMAFGSVGGAAALAIVALAPSASMFVVGLVAIELASAFVLYNAAFACLVQATGWDARRRITHLTLIAGFASTLFWPLTSALHAVLSWREVFGVFAMLNLLVCLPVHFWLARNAGVAPADSASPAPGTAIDEVPLPPQVRRRAFVLVAAGFCLSGFLLSSILAQMVPVLSAVGLGSATVVVSALFGPAQVLARFINMATGSGRHPLTVTLISCAMLPLATLVLVVTAPAVAGAVLFVVLLGFGSGLNSIVHGTLPLALFGRAAYGERLGRIASAQLATTSVAPFALAFLIDIAGPTTALGVMIVIGLLGLSAFMAVDRLRSRTAPASMAPITVQAGPSGNIV